MTGYVAVAALILAAWSGVGILAAVAFSAWALTVKRRGRR